MQQDMHLQYQEPQEGRTDLEEDDSAENPAAWVEVRESVALPGPVREQAFATTRLTNNIHCIWKDGLAPCGKSFLSRRLMTCIETGIVLHLEPWHSGNLCPHSRWTSTGGHTHRAPRNHTNRRIIQTKSHLQLLVRSSRRSESWRRMYQRADV